MLVLPTAHFLPAALPRLATIHPLVPSALAGLPWSSLASSPAHAALATDLAPRRCAPGTLQTPPFPRRHDGVDMLACTLRPA